MLLKTKNSILRTLALLSVMAVSFGMTRSALAGDVYNFIIKKEEEKQKYRWNLWDWFRTRDQMRLQDLWLSLHSSSPYEYYFGGNIQFIQYTGGPSLSPWELFFGAYSSIIGSEARYESGLSVRLHGSLNIRIFGKADQGPNITLQGGILHTDTGFDSYRNPFVGASLTFYITRFFGVTGLYRYYFPSTSNIAGVNYSGNRTAGGGFIDFRFVRIFGEYYTDFGSGPANQGGVFGTKIYF